MHRFIEGADRAQASLLPACLEDYIDADNQVRVVEAFVDALDLDALGFAVIPAATGRPGYHPAMRLTGRLAPDFKTIADFRRDNGLAICAACAQFIVICRDLGLFSRPLAAIDGSKFKGVNARDKNFTRSRSGRGSPSWRRARLSISPRSMPPTARRAWTAASYPAPASCATSSPGSRRRCRS
jgi:transposase